MTAYGNIPKAKSDSDTAAQISRVRDEFESAWQRALTSDEAPPQIATFLQQSGLDQTGELIGELLEVELQFRLRRGDTLSAEPYQRDFHEHAEMVDEICRRFMHVQRLGEYQLLEELGRGGMGVVYRARHMMLDQIVAIKVLPKGYVTEPQAVSRFLREMRAIGGLKHPNMVQAYNAGESEGVHYLVMEYVDGKNLMDLISQSGCLPLGAACELVRQAALGLQHAHENGLVHRDIKPANLILSRTGTIKILDLGLARLAIQHNREEEQSEHLTQEGSAIGTIDYMAPEQWESSRDVDIRSDIYSLGATLFFLLTGKVPYGSRQYNSIRKKFLAHTSAPIPSLLSHVPDCPEDLDKIVHHMMAKDVDDRFDSPIEVADTLSLFADADSLRGLLPHLNSSKVDSHATTYVGIKNPGMDTSRKRTTDRLVTTRGMRSRSPSRPRIRWPIATVGGATVMIISLVLLFAFFGRGGGKGGFPGDDGTQGLESDPQRTQLAAQVQVLPGLNGGWWFEEMPWLVPFARREIADRMTASPGESGRLDLGTGETTPFLQANTAEALDWLRDRVSEGTNNPARSNLLARLLKISDENPDTDSLREILTEARDEYVFDLGEGSWDAMDLHTCAVLEHRLAHIDATQDNVQQARNRYDEALDRYEQSDRPSEPLRVLCLLDLAFLYANHLDDYPKMIALYDEALLLSNDAVIDAQVLTQRGDAACKNERYDVGDASFSRALEKLEASPLDSSHPYHAHLRERIAWSLIYQWRVDAAETSFQKAYSIRNFWAENSADKLSAVYALHNQHGLSMANRFRGKLSMARAEYDGVLDRARELLARSTEFDSAAGDSWFELKLEERRYNTSERRADCELYQGAASRPSEVDLELACQLYQTARDTASNYVSSHAKVAMGYKLAIARAMNRELEAAKLAYDEAITLRREISVEADGGRISLLERLAGAVITLKTEDTRTGQTALRAILRDMYLANLNAKEKMRSEILELYMFSAELLVASSISEGDAATASTDLNHFAIVLSRFPGYRELSPYLLRHYELAAESVWQTEPGRAARFVLHSQFLEQPNDSVAVIFFLPAHYIQQKNGVVFVMFPNGDCDRYELPFDRQQVLRSYRPDSSLMLPDEFVEQIKQVQKSGQAVRLFWNDAVCWPAGSLDALTERNWPFAGQVELGFEDQSL